MTITPEQIDKVQASFEKVVPIADKVADIFYDELFTIDPELKKLFKGDLSEQKKKLMQTLVIVIRGLKTPDKIIPAAEELARKHVKYGVKPEDYTSVGNALLRTLKKGLGDAFTDDLRQAWVEAFRLLADVMKKAAY
jgi:hemoglobin-like flavoprotein